MVRLTALGEGAGRTGVAATASRSPAVGATIAGSVRSASGRAGRGDGAGSVGRVSGATAGVSRLLKTAATVRTIAPIATHNCRRGEVRAAGGSVRASVSAGTDACSGAGTLGRGAVSLVAPALPVVDVEGVATTGAMIATPCSRQKSARFCRVSATIGWSAESDADAIAAARR